MNQMKKDVKDYYKELYGIDLKDEQIEQMYHPNRAAGDISVSPKKKYQMIQARTVFAVRA